jgi:hypothetical protein
MVDRFGVVAIALAMGACAAPVKPTAAPVHVDEDFAVWPPRMPGALDLDSVPLGRWAQYEETYLGSVTIKERVALVGKGADGDTLETITELRPGEQTVFATVLAPAGQVTSNLFQTGDAEPMSAPPAPASQQPYPRLDPNKLVGSELVTVRVGTFRAKHYRDRTEFGEQVDVWIDESMGPLGVLKLEAEQKQHPTIRAGFSYTLVATGNDAIPRITRPPLPFDPTLLKQRGLPWTRQKRIGPQPPAKVVQ